MSGREQTLGHSSPVGLVVLDIQVWLGSAFLMFGSGQASCFAKIALLNLNSKENLFRSKKISQIFRVVPNLGSYIFLQAILGFM